MVIAIMVTAIRAFLARLETRKHCASDYRAGSYHQADSRVHTNRSSVNCSNPGSDNEPFVIRRPVTLPFKRGLIDRHIIRCP